MVRGRRGDAGRADYESESAMKVMWLRRAPKARRQKDSQAQWKAHFSNLSAHGAHLFLILSRTGPVQDTQIVSTKLSLAMAIL